MLKTLMPRLHKRLAAAAFAAAALGTVCPTTAQAASLAEQPADENHEAAIDAAVQEIEKIANDVANARKYFDEDLRPIGVKASFSPDDGLLYFDFDASLGPEAGYTEMADLTTDIELASEDISSRLPGFGRISYRFGGHDTGWWLERSIAIGPAPASRPEFRAKRTASTEPGPVVVTGGHGFYYNYGQKRWTSHRDPVNGLLEDEVTQVFANKLHGYLKAKRIQAENLRDFRSGLTHEPSGLAWWKVGARYHLEASHEDLANVWNSEPADTEVDRERKQDIRSRPLYANHVNASAVLHIHTNAASVAASGTRAYVYPGRPADTKLASLVLCGMAELIHSVDRFAAYKVPASPAFYDKHAETRLAKIPAVIVEVGFHTNPEDAAYLVDSHFQSVSMKGVAKGYRLYRDGKDCAPFTIVSDKAADVVVWGRGRLPVDVGGNPDYPITVTTQALDCETCQPEQNTIWDVAALNRFRVEHGCRPEDLDRSPIRYQVMASDAFGVKSNASTYTFNCKPRGARVAAVMATR
ncbi:MAG TPA: N-acetylmuramoyl-L-alanine amidase [Luteibacter sp.]|jgi:N-acetylmuramoyl-L-alanine amidase|uniref:N-acetylmuramoyl-L-alanine amidase n=1 Tax=Luteibacter sp. TaxID=1886636 RepID=UPI002F3F9379